MSGDDEIAVVGGGVAGLAAALTLARRGLRVTVLEAGPRPGGCVQWHRVGGLRIDRGAESFALARPAVGRLAEQLGLPVETPTRAGAWVRHHAGQAPLPTGTLLGIPANPGAADVRRVIGTWGSRRARLDRWIPRTWTGSGTVGDLVGRRMGRAVLTRLVEPVVGGVYSTDPSHVSIDTVAPGLRAALAATGSLAGAVAQLRAGAPPAGSAVAGLRGGMASLTEALVAALGHAGAELRCDTRVVEVRRDGPGWSVTAVSTHTGSPSPARYREVVLAVPAPVAAAVVSRATDGTVSFPSPPTSPVLLVTLVVEAPALDDAPRGSGMLVSRWARGVAAKALTHATAKWRYLAETAGPGRHVLRLSYGRGGVLPSPDRFPALALADASALFGVSITARQLVDFVLVDYPDQLGAAGPQHLRARDEALRALIGWSGLTVIGSAVSGTGLGGVVQNATDTALQIANRVGAQ